MTEAPLAASKRPTLAGRSDAGACRRILCGWAAQRWSAVVDLAVLGLVVFLSNLPAANAQSNLSAREEWYGLYETNEIAAPGSSSDHSVVPVPPKSNTDRIPGRVGTRFGLSFVITGGTGQGVQDVKVKRVMHFPPFTYVIPLTVRIGEPQLWSYEFKQAPREDFFGEWSWELWQEDRKLLERRFTVYRP
jgi:hypothetical protein